MPNQAPILAGQCHQMNRHRMICVAAYYLAEERGFAPGHAEADWLAAERLIDAALAVGTEPYQAAAALPSAVRYALRLHGLR